MAITLDGTTGISASGNVTGGNIVTTGAISASGNITAAYLIGNASQLTGSTKINNGTSEANIGASGGNANISIGGTSNVAVFASTGEYVTGVMSASGNVTGGNIVTAGLITATGNINSTGNVSGSYLLGNAFFVSGLSPTRIYSGTTEVNIPVASGNANVTVGGTSNVWVAATSGIYVTGLQSVTGNVTGGNINTAGLVSATGNIIGGNLSGTSIVGTLTTAAQTNITSVGTLTGGTWTATAVGLAYGGTGKTTAPAGMAALMGYTQTATAAGTTTLTNTSSYYQQFVGSSTQTVVLPVTSTLQTGWTFHIVNNSLANISVQSSGLNAVITVIPGTTAMCTCIGTSLTTAADWESGITDFSTYTGTGDVVLATSPTLTTPNIGAATGTSLSVSGNITGAYLYGNASTVTGLSASKIFNGTSEANIGTSGGNANISIAGTSNVLVVASTGIYTTGLSSVTGNITGGNINTAGLVSATGNIIGGNLTTAGQVSATGNITGGNILGGANVNATIFTGTTVSVTGNITGGNILGGANVNATIFTGTTVSVTGNVTGGNIITNSVVGTAVTITSTAGDITLTSSGNVILNTEYINGARDPVQNQDVATKAYVDQQVSTGIAYHTAVAAATTGTLATATGGTITYNNGTAGVGATLTTTTTFTTIDGVNIATPGTRILVKNETNQTWNGVYTYTSGTVLTRSTDTDEYGSDSTTALSINDYFYTTSGTVNVGVAFVLSAPTGTITFGTSNLVFATFSTSQVYSAGTGLTLTNTTFSVNASQTQITSVGTLSSLSATGNIVGGNINTAGLVSATGNIIGGNLNAAGLSLSGNVVSAINTTNNITVTTGNVSIPTATANTNTTQAASTAYVVGQAGALSPNTIGTAAVGTSLKYAREDHTHGGVGSAVAGTGISVSGATGAVTITNAGVTSLANGGGITASVSTGAITLGSTATNANTASAIVARDASGNFSAGTITATLSGAATSATTAGTVTTAAQPNITSVGTLTGLTLSGTLTGTTLNAAAIGNTGATLTGTLQTAAQTNITSVGTLTGGTWNASVIQPSYIATLNQNTSGYAATVSGAAQGNITSVGTLTALTVSGAITVNSGAAATAIVNGATTGVGNIGSTTTTFNTVFAKATTAQYADLAENYSADAEYAPGTVLIFGGNSEVTVSNTDMNKRVVGVVSTNPAYLMNSHMEAEHVVSVALTGRAPCRVVGTVRKGDMMVATLNGCARAEENPVLGSVIGKAVQDFDGAEGVIEILVGRV